MLNNTLKFKNMYKVNIIESEREKESWTREVIIPLFYDYLNTDYVHIHNSIGEAVELANIFLNKNHFNLLTEEKGSIT